MCVAIPLQLKKVDGNYGIGIRDGVSREIRLDFVKDPKPGEYVIVHAGFAIERIEEDMALESIALAEEVEAELADLYNRQDH